MLPKAFGRVLAQQGKPTMPYQITYQPLNRIPGVKPKTVTIETAAEAWTTVQQLEASDEQVTITGSSGHPIGKFELRDLAAKESH